jgi:hypothetical protein
LGQLHVFPGAPQGVLHKPMFSTPSRICGNITNQCHWLKKWFVSFLSFPVVENTSLLPHSAPPHRASPPSSLSGGDGGGWCDLPLPTRWQRSMISLSMPGGGGGGWCGLPTRRW